MEDIKELQALLRDFAQERHWERFHTAKNLSTALCAEAGELAAEFQWLTAEESDVDQLGTEKLHAIGLEIADVAIYLLRLADVLRVDIPTVVREKTDINRTRFTAP